MHISEATASEICRRLYLDEAALGLLRPNMAPREFIDALVNGQQYMPAIDFIAHALPAREAIWWGCLCLQRVSGKKLEPWERRAFRLTVQWVFQPNEFTREATRQPAEVLGPSSVPGLLAAAANQTGGSMGPPQGPFIAPSPFAPARSVAIAVKVASTKADPPEIQPTQRAFVDLGIMVAEGRLPPEGDPS